MTVELALAEFWNGYTDNRHQPRAFPVTDGWIKMAMAINRL